MKKIIEIIAIITVLIATMFALTGCKKTKNENQEAPIVLKSYVEENAIEILSANETYEIPVKPYAKDENKNIIIPEGVTFEDTNASIKYYDYKVSEENEEGYATFSFKYDIEIPIKYTVDTSKNNSKWSRSLALPLSAFFDYYTGDVYREKNVSLDNKAKFYNINNLNNNDEYMSFINVTWNNKEYKIGVRTETVSKWDGIKEIANSNGIKTYTDIQRTTVNVSVYAPKDYDGIMVAMYKKGTSKEEVEFIKQQYNKYLEEHKSDVNQIENKIYKILENKYIENEKYSKDDFYVIRIKDIKNVE